MHGHRAHGRSRRINLQGVTGAFVISMISSVAVLVFATAAGNRFKAEYGGFLLHRSKNRRTITMAADPHPANHKCHQCQNAWHLSEK